MYFENDKVPLPLKKDKKDNLVITKYGHTMFIQDIVQDLNIKFRASKELKLRDAEMQFLGFAIGSYRTGSLFELVNSMGLKETEWRELKKRESVNNLRSIDIQEINNYFENG